MEGCVLLSANSHGAGDEVHAHAPEKVDVLGIPVSPANLMIPQELDNIQNSNCPTIITFVNPHACFVAESNKIYLDQLKKFDWVLCDGIGMVVAARRLANDKIYRAAFDLTSIAGPVFQWLENRAIPVVLVGGQGGISEQAASLLSKLFPGLIIQKTFSGFDGGPERAGTFMATHPGTAVICGMGAPRQEDFLYKLKESGWRGVGFTCGGFFDQLVQNTDYYPAWIDRLNLRFLYRLIREPRRLWRRYLIEYQVFLGRFFKTFLFE